MLPTLSKNFVSDYFETFTQNILYSRLIRNKNDYLIYVLILVLSILIANIISLIKSWPLISISKLHFTDFRRHIKPILLLFFASVVGSVYINLDVFILGYLVGDTYVGYFSLNKKVVSLVIAIVGSLGVILVPRMSYLIKNRLINQYNELAQLSLNFIYFLGFPAVFLLLALSREVVYILGGYDFFPSILSLRIMSVQVFITSLATFFGFQVLLANNDEKSLLYSNILGSIVNLTINLFLVKSYFHIATSVSIVLSELAVLVTQLLLSKKYRTFRLLSNSIHIYFYGSVLSLLSVLFLNIILIENYILSFFIKLVVAGLVYFFYLIYKKEYFTHKALFFLKGILFNE